MQAAKYLNKGEFTLDIKIKKSLKGRYLITKI
jgi:hypothetical protein